MAQLDISNYKKIEKQKNTIQERVFWTYTDFCLDGQIYFQIDTYGRSSRETPDRISQSFQFDRESAKLVVNLLIKKFELS